MRQCVLTITFVSSLSQNFQILPTPRYIRLQQGRVPEVFFVLEHDIERDTITWPCWQEVTYCHRSAARSSRLCVVRVSKCSADGRCHSLLSDGVIMNCFKQYACQISLYCTTRCTTSLQNRSPGLPGTKAKVKECSTNTNAAIVQI